MEVKENTLRSVKLSSIKTLPFNRDVKQKHVKSLMKSVSLRGILRAPVLAKTKAITGKMELYSLDGQHLIDGLKQMDSTHVDAYVIETNSLADIVQTMAVLNNVQQKWTILDYVNCYCGLNNPEYLELKKHSIDHSLSINVSAVILSGVNSSAWGRGLNSIKNGIFAVMATDKNVITKNLLQVMGTLNINSTKFAIAFITFCRSLGSDYDHKRMMRNLKKNAKEIEAFPHDVDFIYDMLVNIY